MRFDPQSNFVPGNQGGRLPGSGRPWGRMIVRGLVNLLVLGLIAAVPVAGYWVWKDYQSLPPGDLQRAELSPQNAPPRTAPAKTEPTKTAATETAPTKTVEVKRSLPVVQREPVRRTGDLLPPRENRTPSQQAYDRGKSALDRGEHQRAIRNFREAVRIKPDYAQAHYSLALAHVLGGDHVSAREEQVILVQLDENLARLLDNVIH
jgi:tetratricopeptide (TPR) repeat protein